MRNDADVDLQSAGDLRNARAAPPHRAGHAKPATRDLAGGWNPRESWLAFLVVAGLLLTAVFTALDPGPSRGLGLPARLLFWTAHVMIPLALLQTAQMALSRIRIVSRLHAWVQIGLSGVIGAALFTPIALVFDQIFAVADTVKETGEPVTRQLVTEFASFLPASILVWGGLNASRLLRLDGVIARAPKSAAPSEPPDPASEFWQRLPKHLGRDLVALTAELHYLRVYTTLGDTLILYSFGRAVEELGARGHQVHRSHWIAEAHLAGVNRDGDRYACRTDTGLLVPLSRPHRRKMRDLCAPEPM
ncbi:LytTR family DNA-binding domain-containing protein [Jannaschia donghaensis]|uniref:LytTr DNA-binding domain protein n=1 Tax=Jannaschia donghaensis TaxID=420998 RepID=A0A0M6YHQ7_9RHOB|nr:LytTR family DNA-binding domain-containing protein [Jannaschia donghaensis]CTQ49454.1 LytTr DNA-binding domain protein [Jannaschia donghaensis]